VWQVAHTLFAFPWVVGKNVWYEVGKVAEVQFVVVWHVVQVVGHFAVVWLGLVVPV
jgi:hypothetical protein